MLIGFREDPGFGPALTVSKGGDDAEFFAVTSEYFFEQPDVLHGEYTDVYRLLGAYYRQDPLSRRKVG